MLIMATLRSTLILYLLAVLV